MKGSVIIRLGIAVLGAMLNAAVLSAQVDWGFTNGPYGGLVYDLCTPRPGVLFASVNNNGVLMSTDDGQSWAPRNNGIYRYVGEALITLPNGDVLFGTSYGVLYRTSNVGESWSSCSGFVATGVIKDFAADAGGSLFASVWGQGIFRSTDGGDTWAQSNSGLTQLNVYCLLAHGSSGVFAGTQDGVFRSTDDGVTWTPCPITGAIYTMEAGKDGSVWISKQGAGMLRSADNGQSWQPAGKISTFISAYRMLHISATEILVTPGGGAGVYRTLDGGQTWTPFGDGLKHPSTTYRLLQDSDGDVFLSSFGEGMYKLARGSSRWQLASDGMQASQIEALLHTASGRLLAGGRAGLWYSDDDGRHWTQDAEGLGESIVYSMARVDTTLFCVAGGDAVYMSSDDGLSWQKRNTGIYTTAVKSIDAGRNGVLYVGTEGQGVYTSTDLGAHWTTINDGLASLDVYAVAETQAGTLLAATKQGIYRSTNYGVLWSNAFETSRFYSIWSQDGLSFTSTSGRLYRSTDDGLSWTNVSPQSIFRVCYDFVKGLDGKLYAAASTQVSVSTDGGVVWSNQYFGPSVDEIVSLEMDAEGRIYASSRSAGVLRIPPLQTGAEVTLRSTPASCSYTVDGTPYSGVSHHVWSVGSTHIVGTQQVQSEGTKIRHVWREWSDGGAMEHPISVSSMDAIDLEVRYDTEFKLDMTAEGSGSVSPVSGWQADGGIVQINATPQGSATFTGWEGTGEGSYTGVANPVNITMRGPITQLARFTGGGQTREISITTDPVSRSILLDGVEYKTSKTVFWTLGSTHTLSTVSPQPSGSPGLRYSWKSWSNGQPMSHSITVDVSTPMNITATFDVEYELKTAAAAGGTVTPATGWYIRGSSVQLHANPSAGYAFDRWEGTFAGKDNPMTVEMNRAVDETAYFTQTSSAGDAEAPAAFELRSASPNPCTAAATIVFSLPAREAVSLLVTDLLGRVAITAVDNVEHEAGTHVLALNVSALPSGIYLLQLRGAGEMRTRRMLVLR